MREFGAQKQESVSGPQRDNMEPAKDYCPLRDTFWYWEIKCGFWFIGLQAVLNNEMVFFCGSCFDDHIPIHVFHIFNVSSPGELRTSLSLYRWSLLTTGEVQPFKMIQPLPSNPWSLDPMLHVRSRGV